jgi:predicted Zn-dependent peptidase
MALVIWSKLGLGANAASYFMKTQRSCVCVVLQVMKKDVGKALSILGDILLNSKLDEAAIVRERDVILREMEEVRLLLLSSVAFGFGSFGTFVS